MASREDLGKSFEDFVGAWSAGTSLLIDKVVGWEALKVLELHCPELIEQIVLEGSRGTTYAANLVDAGLVLKETNNLEGFDKVLERLKGGEDSALRELVVAAILVKAGMHTQLEPPLNTRKPDVGFLFDGEMVFTEVISPNSSAFQKRINDAMMGLAWHLLNKNRKSAVNIVMLDDPDPELLGNMASIDGQVNESPLYGVPYSFDNRIEWAYSKPVPPYTSVPSMESKDRRTNLSLVVADINNGAHISVGYLLNEPKRLSQFIDQEIKHFARDTVNLLVIDAKNALLGNKEMVEIVSRRLQPSINRRLSGVLLLSEFYQPSEGGTRILREWTLVTNPYACKPLSKSLVKFLDNLGSHQLW